MIEEGRVGRISMRYQPGHPHGFCSAIWMGEVAICRPLLDPAHAIANLKEKVSPYSDALAEALIARFHWEIAFSIDNAESALRRDDQTQIAGLAHRALCCAAQTLFALNRRYLINEKGAIAELADLPLTIPNAGERIEELWSAIGRRDFRTAIALLRGVAAVVDQLVN